jgi:uncharacterized linocin/CFP29 family protein
MNEKVLSNKEKLKGLLDKIQEIKRINKSSISILAGYESGNYISERMSVNDVSDDLVKAVNSLYLRAKNDPSILINVNKEDLKKSVKINDSLGVTLENQIEILATGRTILSVLAELQAPLKKGSLPTQLANTYRKMVKDEAELIRVELKQRR